MVHDRNTILALYKKVLNLYPRGFRELLGESMEQTFNDLYKERRRKPGWFSFVLWMFVETAVGIVKEHVLLITRGATMKNVLSNPRSAARISPILLAVAFILAPAIYLFGDWRDALGRAGYALADFLYGPVWGASLVTMVFILRERIGALASRRMSLALLAAILAAAAMVLVACIRSANRQYHLHHPELHLENSQTILIVWTTLVAGVTAAGWHFLGWTLLLVGSSGWTSGRLPRLLSALYLVGGTVSLFVYLLPEHEGTAGLLGVLVSVWQGLLFWRNGSEETPAPDINTSRFGQV